MWGLLDVYVASCAAHVRLEQVVQDGTKIKAQAANDSFQGAARIAPTVGGWGPRCVPPIAFFA